MSKPCSWSVVAQPLHRCAGGQAMAALMPVGSNLFAFLLSFVAAVLGGQDHLGHCRRQSEQLRPM